MAQFSIIIPTWNLWEMTKACLESIAQVCAKDGLLASMEVIVVDNNSTDTTATALEPTLKRLFKHCGHVLRMPENVGFAKACNAGAKKARNPLLFFLNNDTSLTEGCIPPLLEALERNPKLGMVGPLLLYTGNIIQHAGICFNPTLELEHIHQFLPASYVKNLKEHSWQAITGAAMLIPAKIFHDCQGFFEGYVNGFEDLDLCCIVRSKGYGLNIVHKSSIYHYTSQTPGRFDHDKANTALLGQRRTGAFTPDKHRIALDNGLTPLLSPTLHMHICITESKDKAFTQIFTENFNENLCRKYLEAEPYWLNGYHFLANHLENKGQWHEALDYRLRGVQLAPLQENFIRLAKCAAKVGQKEILKNAELCMADYRANISDKDSLKHKTQALKHLAEQNSDMELMNILEQWTSKNLL